MMVGTAVTVAVRVAVRVKTAPLDCRATWQNPYVVNAVTVRVKTAPLDCRAT
jgi:hypothetical protein